MKIILATTSPYRKAVFGYLGLDFTTEASNVDESQAKRDDPEKLVSQLAELKAKAVAKNHQDAIVLGMDSVGFFDGKILEKPKSREEAFARLKALSGNRFDFYTGVFLINTVSNKIAQRVIKTEGFFRELSEEEINNYLDKDTKYTTYAAGFDPEKNYGATFSKKINGSYNNFLHGIPLEIIPEILKEVGYK